MNKEARSNPGRGLGTPVSFTARCCVCPSPLWPRPLPGARRAEVVEDLLPEEPEEGDGHGHEEQEVEPEQVGDHLLGEGNVSSGSCKMLDEGPVIEAVVDRGGQLLVAHERKKTCPHFPRSTVGMGVEPLMALIIIIIIIIIIESSSSSTGPRVQPAVWSMTLRNGRWTRWRNGWCRWCRRRAARRSN